MRDPIDHLTATTVLGAVNLRDALAAARAGKTPYPRHVVLGDDQWAIEESPGVYTLLDPIPDPQSSGVINVASEAA